MFNLKKMEAEQARLSRKLILKDSFEADKIEKIAGADQTFINNTVISAIAVCDYKTMKTIEKKYAVVKAKMPYAPGFLSYRESPAVIEAYHLLERDFDVLLVDCNGILHPRKFGMASHIGLALGKPTIGIAKSLLLGEAKDGKIYVDGELRGAEVRTKEHANPLYVSPGHLISLKTAEGIVRQCIVPPHKMPEPLHLAHKYGDQVRKMMVERKGQTEQNRE